MHARPDEISALMDAIRAEEKVALKDLKLEWVRKEQAERQAAAVLRASQQAATALVLGAGRDSPKRPRPSARAKPRGHSR